MHLLVIINKFIQNARYNNQNQRFTVCLWRKSHQKCWRKSHWQSAETCGSSTTGLRLTLLGRSENISQPLALNVGLKEAGLWLGLPGHRTSHQWTSFCAATLKTLFPRRQLILKTILWPVLLRQHQPPRSNLAILESQINLRSVTVGCVSTSASLRLNVCSKLVTNHDFPSEYFKGFA